MEKQLDQILKELEESRKQTNAISSDVVDLKVLQGQNHVILREHIRRTEANEALILLVKNELNKRLDRSENFKWLFTGIAGVGISILTYVLKFN